MPSLTNVTLDKKFAFRYKITVHTKSPSSSSPSFLDITPALQQYLSFPLSYTPYLQQLLSLSPHMPSKQICEPTHQQLTTFNPTNNPTPQKHTPHPQNVQGFTPRKTVLNFFDSVRYWRCGRANFRFSCVNMMFLCLLSSSFGTTAVLMIWIYRERGAFRPSPSSTASQRRGEKCHGTPCTCCACRSGSCSAARCRSSSPPCPARESTEITSQSLPRSRRGSHRFPSSSPVCA